MSRKKSSSRVDLKAASQEERIEMWNEHFKNLVENSSHVTDNSITEITNCQQDIKLGQFTEEELTKSKSKKAASHERMEDKRIWWLTSILQLCL